MEPQSISERIDLLGTNVDRIDYRLSYSEQLHREVGEDGDIHHYGRMIPFVALAGLVGAAGVMCFLYFRAKNRTP